MRTISIPLSKLIKFIPSGPDGGVIPGKVVYCDFPNLVKPNAYEIQLHYKANSALDVGSAFCKLDEELEMVRESNELDKRTLIKHQYPHVPVLHEDGVVYAFNGSVAPAAPYWDTVKTWLVVPSPFGVNPLSPFTRHGRIQIACCYMGHGLHIAIIGKDFHKITKEPLIVSRLDDTTYEPMTFGAPCQHGEEWLIPWQSKSRGICITRMQASEMDSFIDNAVTLPKK